jgi:hypothetical protein
VWKINYSKALKNSTNLCTKPTHFNLSGIFPKGSRIWLLCTTICPLRATFPNDFPWFDQRKIIWRSSHIKYLSIHFSPASYYLPFLRSNYLPQHLIFQTSSIAPHIQWDSNLHTYLNYYIAYLYQWSSNTGIKHSESFKNIIWSVNPPKVYHLFLHSIWF